MRSDALTSGVINSSSWAVSKTSGGAAYAPVAKYSHEFIAELDHVGLRISPCSTDFALAPSILLLQ